MKVTSPRKSEKKSHLASEGLFTAPVGGNTGGVREPI